MPASYPAGPNQAFGAGLNHMTNPTRANGASITLNDAARWGSDRGLYQSVHPSALSAGTPANTDMAAELGQEAAGNTNDAALAQGDMQHALMRQAGRIGADDNIA